MYKIKIRKDCLSTYEVGVVSIESDEEAEKVADGHNQLKKLIEGENLSLSKVRIIETFAIVTFSQLSLYHQLLPCLLQGSTVLLLVDGDAAVQVDHEVDPCNKYRDPSKMLLRLSLNLWYGRLTKEKVGCWRGSK